MKPTSPRRGRHSHQSALPHLSIVVVVTVVVVSALTSACGGGDGQPAQPSDLEPPPECALAAPPAGFVYPAGPYGAEVDDTFEDIALEDCDGVEVAFGDVLAQAELVLFNVGAGWCEPCVEESMALDQEIFREFCPRGLRVVQVLFQDEQSRPATRQFCSAWRAQFGLSFPVLADPLFETDKYFESVLSQTPINFLIDRDGVIQFVETGVPSGDLPQRVDALLPR